MVKSTMLVLLCGLFISGCSSTNWAKADKSDFSSAELESALEECKYNEAMKVDTKNLLSTSSQVKNSSNVSHNELDEMTIEDVNQAKESVTGMANSDVIHNNMTMAKQAYQCLEDKGFVRIK